MNKRLVLLWITLLILIGISISGCGNQKNSNDDNGGRVVTDMQGTEVTIPDEINNYAVAWTGDFDIAAMIDNCEHISAYPETSLKFPMVMETYPNLSDCTPLPKVNVSAESIIEENPQVVFLRQSDYPELTDELKKANIPVVELNFENYDELIKAVELFAEVMNTDEAKAKAKAYKKYVNATIEETKELVGKQQFDQEISVLNFRDAVDFTAYSKDRLVGSWAGLCNIKYAMDSDDTENKTLTAEQIFELDPDYIFFTFPGNKELMMSNDKYRSLKAVKNGNVYDAPAVLNSFAVNGAEAILQIKWAVSVIWPENVDFDIIKEVQDFYKTFYNLELDEATVKEIMY